MRTLPAEFAALLAGEVVHLTVCWVITKNDGSILRGTAHDKDVTIAAGDYAGTYLANMGITSSDVASASDGSVQNLEVDGAFFAAVPNFTVADLEAGLFDQATAVLLLVDWSDPDAGQKVITAGTLGEFWRDSDGWYRTEVRSIAQRLQQIFTRSYSERCEATFGDAVCMFVPSTLARGCTITSVTNRRRFEASLDSGPAHTADAMYFGGTVTWLTGDNAGFTREVRCHNVPTTDIDLLLFDESPADVEVGDSFTLTPGCDKQYGSCRFLFNNLVNFQGYGALAAGRDRLMAGPNAANSAYTLTSGSIVSEAEYDAARSALQALGLTIMGL